MRFIQVGQQVMLKPERADAYGEPRETVYTVAKVWGDRNGYKRLWIAVEGRPTDTFKGADFMAPYRLAKAKGETT